MPRVKKRTLKLRYKNRSNSSRGGKTANRNNRNKTVFQHIVANFLEMLNTVKLYHWKTHSYATHKATDQLYTSLNGKIDEFVEVMLGKTTIVSESDITRAGILNQPALHFVSYKDNADFRNQIEYYKKFLINLSSLPGLNVAANTDLFAIRDEMLALLNQFLYLLTLK
jgi:DNA-binding ferritin-like protein